MAWPRGKRPTPEQRARLARQARDAGLARTTPDYYIRKLAEATLTDEQRQRLAAVLMRDIEETQGVVQ